MSTSVDVVFKVWQPKRKLSRRSFLLGCEINNDEKFFEYGSDSRTVLVAELFWCCPSFPDIPLSLCFRRKRGMLLPSKYQTILVWCDPSMFEEENSKCLRNLIMITSLRYMPQKLRWDLQVHCWLERWSLLSAKILGRESEKKYISILWLVKKLN